MVTVNMALRCTFTDKLNYTNFTLFFFQQCRNSTIKCDSLNMKLTTLKILVGLIWKTDILSLKKGCGDFEVNSWALLTLKNFYMMLMTFCLIHYSVWQEHLCVQVCFRSCHNLKINVHCLLTDCVQLQDFLCVFMHMREFVSPISFLCKCLQSCLFFFALKNSMLCAKLCSNCLFSMLYVAIKPVLLCLYSYHFTACTRI